MPTTGQRRRSRAKGPRGGQVPDPLQLIKRATVAIGTLPDTVLALPGNQQYYSGDLGGFEVHGAGFIYAYTPLAFAKGKSQPDPKTGAVYYWAAIWIVTCKHCLQVTAAVAVRIGTKSGGTRVYPIHSEKWTAHPTEDVAVAPLALGIPNRPSEEELLSINDVDLATIAPGDTAAKSQIARMGFYESTPVSMVGFPVGMIEGGKKNYPVVRAGTIAQIQGYLDGDPEHTRFLIDGSVFGGNSGGPIVVREGTWNAEASGKLSSTVLIGMVSSSSYTDTMDQDRKSTEVMQNADLVEAVTVDSINDTIYSRCLRERNR